MLIALIQCEGNGKTFLGQFFLGSLLVSQTMDNPLANQWNLVDIKVDFLKEYGMRGFPGSRNYPAPINLFTVTGGLNQR